MKRFDTQVFKKEEKQNPFTRSTTLPVKQKNSLPIEDNMFADNKFMQSLSPLSN